MAADDKINITNTPDPGGMPTVPSTAANPYDVTKLLGPIPDLKALTTPAPVADQSIAGSRGQPTAMPTFIESPGGGRGQGHFATAEDIKAHTEARDAAVGYLQLAQHIHTLHDETQKSLDTAGALHQLTGFDYTHPDAETNLSKILAENPNYDPSKIHPILDIGRQRAAILYKNTPKPNADIKDFGALDTTLKGLNKDLNATHFQSDWYPNKDVNGNITSYFIPKPGTAASKDTWPIPQKDWSHNKEQFFTLPKSAYDTIKPHVDKLFGKAITTSTVPKQGEKGYRPTTAEDAAVAARLTPTISGPTTKPVDKYF